MKIRGNMPFSKSAKLGDNVEIKHYGEVLAIGITTFIANGQRIVEAEVPEQKQKQVEYLIRNKLIGFTYE